MTERQNIKRTPEYEFIGKLEYKTCQMPEN